MGPMMLRRLGGHSHWASLQNGTFAVMRAGRGAGNRSGMRAARPLFPAANRSAPAGEDRQGGQHRVAFQFNQGGSRR
jgi:hypothetical protein